MIFSIKTVIGRERVVMEAIAARVQSRKLPIKAIFNVEEIKGYVFIEGELSDVEKVIRAIPHARGLVRKPVELSKLKAFLQPRKVEIELNIGDVVEVVGGPFKGERGKIVRYDKAKRECTLELLEVTVPIPLTVSADLVKIIERKKE